MPKGTACSVRRFPGEELLHRTIKEGLSALGVPAHLFGKETVRAIEEKILARDDILVLGDHTTGRAILRITPE